MKKYINFLIRLSIALASINIIWLGYNSFHYFDVSNWFVIPEIYIMFIFIGLLALFFSHLVISITVILELKKSYTLFISGIVVLVLGTVSFIALFFHWGILTDILKEYPAGYEIQNELIAVWILQLLHFSFLIYSLIYFLNAVKSPEQREITPGLFGEQLFLALNIIGIVCGIIGLFIVVIDFIFRVNPDQYKWAIIPYSMFVLLPYILMLAGWFFHTFTHKISGWYDEKQKSDIFKSGMMTLLISVPVMCILFLLNYHNITGMISILWLPLYLFATLFIFSVSAFYNFRHN